VTTPSHRASRRSRRFALIPAGGTGARIGGSTPKQYLPVAGQPLILYTLAAFLAAPAIDAIVVVVAPGDAWIDELIPVDAAGRIRVIRDGGATRADSVGNGLAALTDAKDDDWVLVHDAARCGIAPEQIEGLVETLADDPVGGLLAVRLDDTVKRQQADDARPVVETTVDRSGLWRAQTPQMFRYRLLRDALVHAAANGTTVTDEASAIEAAGHRVRLVPGSALNFKVTTPDDLAMMDALLRVRPARQRTA
jgi:2-C-methyl-D-erythritol 4-phosphate cytidylyltransferase